MSGISSYGIFMGDQSGVNLIDTHTMLLAGGRLIVDPNSPASMLAAYGSLSVDVNGGVGAVNYCDELGTHCFTASDITGGATGAPGGNREVIFNKNGILGADAGLYYSSSSQLGIGTITPATALDVNGTIRIAYGGEACAAGTIGALYDAHCVRMFDGRQLDSDCGRWRRRWCRGGWRQHAGAV